MKMFLKMLVSFLLIFNGAGAIYGGWNLIADPEGRSMNLSKELLANSPFQNFFIPGIILLLSNGLFCVLALIMILFQTKCYPRFIIYEGLILLGWLITQII